MDKLRPSVGALLVGLFLGWSGAVKWVERAVWAILVIAATRHNWAVECFTFDPERWMVGAAALICGIMVAYPFGYHHGAGDEARKRSAFLREVQGC